jgi:hypothetical protein
LKNPLLNFRGNFRGKFRGISVFHGKKMYEKSAPGHLIGHDALVERGVSIVVARVGPALLVEEAGDGTDVAADRLLVDGVDLLLGSILQISFGRNFRQDYLGRIFRP